jgi:hypothetical protein
MMGAQAQTSRDVPTIMRVQLDSSTKVKRGNVISGHVIEPLYENNQLIVPNGTSVTGQIVHIRPSAKKKRLAALSQGDFSPLHDATIHFDKLTLADGEAMPISSLPANESQKLLRFHSSAAGKHVSFFHRLWNSFVDERKNAVNSITAPGKVARVKQYISAQLPYHSEMLQEGSQYDVMLLKLPESSREESKILREKDLKPNLLSNSAKVVRARLQTDISSRTAKQDQTVMATVTEPVIDSTGQIDIPQGAQLRGRVLRVQRARKFGRNGTLRFTFDRLEFTRNMQTRVTGVPTAVDSAVNQHLNLDAEGGVKPDNDKGIVAPLVMSLLAASALHEDEASIAHAATASNGFGLIVRVAATASGSNTVGGVIGAISAARTIYSRFLAHGHDVTFPRNSEIEVELGR